MSSLRFADGKLTLLNVRYHYDDLTCILSYAFSGYGTTKVTLPTIEGETEIMIDFAVTDTEGNVFRLSQALQEKTLVMLHFWATWFEPCQNELSVLQQVVDYYGNELAFIGISLTDGYGDIEMFRDKLGLTLDMVESKEGADVIEAYENNSTVPHTIIINGNGEIVYNYKGAGTTYSEWQELIEICLNGGEFPEDEDVIVGPCY